MKRLACIRKGLIGWQEVDLPVVGHGQVRIRCQYGVEKHGTMQAFVKGYGNERGRWDVETQMHVPEGVLWDYPVPLGNMQFGRVTEVGPGATLAVGDQVAVSAPFQPELVVNETDCWFIPLGFPWQDALMLDPCEFALGALRDGNVRIGDRVALFGLGAIGLAGVQLAKAAGASAVIALDPIEGRREVALRIGADMALDPSEGDVGLTLRQVTEMRGPDVVIDFSGSPIALRQAIRGITYGGTIVLGAFPPPHNSGIDFGGEFHMNRPKVVASRACSDPNPDHPRWSHRRIQEECFGLICRGAIDGKSVLGPEVAFDDLPDAYQRVAGDPASGVKLTVRY